MLKILKTELVTLAMIFIQYDYRREKSDIFARITFSRKFLNLGIISMSISNVYDY